MSDITIQYKKNRNLFFVLSLICWFGLCGFLIIYGLCVAFKPTTEVNETTEALKTLFMPLIVTYGIAIILVFFIREKIRNTVWIINIIISAAVLGVEFMYVAIALFALDEFVFRPLYNYNKNKYSINLEIDKRNEV